MPAKQQQTAILFIVVNKSNFHFQLKTIRSKKICKPYLITKKAHQFSELDALSYNQLESAQKSYKN